MFYVFKEYDEESHETMTREPQVGHYSIDKIPT